jgi:antitoxin component YwqK of YwqJK toxin-antitoxin module
MKISQEFFLIKIFFNVSVILALFTNSAFAQEKVNQFDANGKRTGTWIKYFDNNQIRYTGNFVAGKEVGVFKYYSENSGSIPIAIKTFAKDSNRAQVQFFSDEGLLESEGEMDGKFRIGKWIYYHPDGKSILSEENYSEGVLNGKFVVYYKNGFVTEETTYLNGKLHGNLKRYAETGILLDDLTYAEGKLHGPAKYYNLEGKLIMAGNYENDEKAGNWVKYDLPE